MKPTIMTVIPNRPLNSDASVDTLDLLLRIAVPQEAPTTERQPLDVALVLDRSGSMSGLPLALAKQAAKLILNTLVPGDRMALVTFDHTAEVVFPLQAVDGVEDLERLIDSIRCGGSTALYAGWQMAAGLLLPEAMQGRLARILLLTDGRANVGLRDPQSLTAHLQQAQQQGVSTSTVGVGLKYDENLLEALAGAGDGNYHFAERPEELLNIFSTELLNLRAILGRRVSLGLQGVQVKDALNDLMPLGTGKLALPPLRTGHTLDLVFRVDVRPGETLNLRLAWDDNAGVRRVERLAFSFPTAPHAFDLPDNPEVVQAREHLLFARAQREVARLADIGDVSGALVLLSSFRNRLYVTGMQTGISVQPQLRQISDLERRLQSNDRSSASKMARKQSYDKSTGREQP